MSASVGVEETSSKAATVVPAEGTESSAFGMGTFAAGGLAMGGFVAGAESLAAGSALRGKDAESSGFGVVAFAVSDLDASDAAPPIGADAAAGEACAST